MLIKGLFWYFRRNAISTTIIVWNDRYGIILNTLKVVKWSHLNHGLFLVLKLYVGLVEKTEIDFVVAAKNDEIAITKVCFKMLCVTVKIKFIWHVKSTS